ncbi:MAG: TMEM43 family protein [Desulfovibrio sp.]|nr:TMEM43 family protein [Desulfovibrio sp.]
MNYTETTSRSWLSRLSSSFGGILLGIVLILAGTVLLWWNEGDFVKTRDALNEAQGLAVELADVQRVDAASNGKLVHATGPTDTQNVLKDPVFGIGGKGIAFERTVEFYQWIEHSRSEKRQTLGGDEETVTTYSYSTDWVGHRVDSQQFHAPQARMRHVNTVLLDVDNQTQHAANVRFGAYRLPSFLIRAISGEQPFTVRLDPTIRERLTRDVLRAKPELVPFHIRNVDRVPLEKLPVVLHAQGGTLYIGLSPAAPQVGDVRVRFTMTPPAVVSIIAQMKGDTFEQFRAANGKKVSALAMGEVSMDNMFADEHSDNAFMTWLFRLLGTLLIVMGLRCVLAPLAVIASLIPMLGNLVGAGTGFVSLLLGVAWSLIIVSIAWLRFRPAIGGIMLAVAVGLVVLLYIKAKMFKAAAAAQGLTWKKR